MATPVGRVPLASPDRLHCSDLDVSIYLGHVPDGMAGELPGLYGSLSSTLDWFLAYDRKPPNGACVLEQPRHVVLFHHAGDTVDILNRSFACEPEDASRICRALFRCLPGVQRIHLSVMFPPHELGFPQRVLERLDHMVIDLPGSVDEYYASLGKPTRKNVRRYQNRLSRAFPDVSVEVVKPGPRSRELVDRLIEWKIQRFRAHGRLTYWETDPTLAGRVTDLLRRCGEARITYVAGREAAIELCFRVGETAYNYEGAHDPQYDEFSLGFLTLYWFVCSAVESGATRVNAMEGTEGSKTPLGAQPVRTTNLSVFRSRLARLRSLDESFKVLRRRSRSAYYALGRRVRRHRGGEALAQFMKRRRLKRWSESHPDR